MSEANPAQSTRQIEGRISARDDGLDHWYCCDPNVSLCGRDLSESNEVAFDEASCVVCEALVDSDCPGCNE